MPIKRILLVAAMPFLLTGCLATGAVSLALQGAEMLDTDFAEWEPSEPVERIRAEQIELRHQVGFEPGGTEIAATERARLDRFLSQAAIQPYETVTIATAAGAFATARAELLAAALAGRGLSTVSATRIAAPGAGDADRVLLRVARDVVITPDCFDTGTGGRQGVSFMKGCANEIILGQMIANPADLNRNRAVGPSDGEAAARAIERYRNGKTTPLLEEETTGDVL